MIPARRPELDALEEIRSELRHVRAELADVSRRLPPQLGTMDEAAEVLGVTRSTVHRMIKRGEIQPRRFGRALRIDLAALRPATDEDVAEALAGRGGRR